MGLSDEALATARRGEPAPSTIPIIDPVTEEQFGEITDGGERAVDEAVKRARSSFDSAVWHGKTPSERAKIIWKAADLLEERAEELGAIDSRNVGKTLQQSRNVLGACVEQLRYFSGWCT
jgi:aldehyde dehydrogenase (NAD+)